MDAFIGTIMGWAPNFAPRSWAFCAGQLMAISQNTALFSLLGTAYGGDGRTTFGLPELRGRVPVMAGQSPGTSSYRLGQITGTEQASLTTQNMPSHNHTADTTGLSATPAASTSAADTDTPSATHVPAAANFDNRGTPQAVNAYNTSPDTTLAGGPVAGNVTIGFTGGSQPFSIVQPVQAINFIICLQGIFPPRN